MSFNLSILYQFGHHKNIQMGKLSLLQTNPRPLRTFEIWLYGLGHVLNDLSAACWANYLLYFLLVVPNTSSAMAG